MSTVQHEFEATNVTCVVPAPNGDRTIFQDIHFVVQSGEIVDLVGPSGAGKSTLLTSFARLNPHTTGIFTLDGKDSNTFTPQQWRQHVSYLPQQSTLIGDDVAAAIRLPWTLKIRGGSMEAAIEQLPDQKIRNFLDSIGCSDIDLTRPPQELSGGQAARVSLARTLLTEPEVLLADEVDAGLDEENAERVGAIMTQAAQHGMAIMRVRHRQSDHRAVRIMKLADGQLTVECTSADECATVDETADAANVATVHVSTGASAASTSTTSQPAMEEQRS